MRRLFRNHSGFSLIGLSIILVIMGLLILFVYASVQRFKYSKIERMHEDFQGLYSAVEKYRQELSELPGDRDRDGHFDANFLVRYDLNEKNLAYEWEKNPFGGEYCYGADTSSTPEAHKNGNYIKATDISPEIAEWFDVKIDDGVDSTGDITANGSYKGKETVDVYWFFSGLWTGGKGTKVLE